MSKLSKTILVTGGTAGLGYQCALALARQRPHSRIVIASRSDKDNAAATINKRLGQSNVEFLPLDLSSLAKVREFASRFAEKQYSPIQSLVLNAGLQFTGGASYTADGIESTFATNHVGHVLLFNLLRQHLEEDARIVLTSSGTHDPAQNTGMPFPNFPSAELVAHPTSDLLVDGKQRYSTSKLANVLWMYALNKRIAAAPGTKWTVTVMDPGLMPGTGLAREHSPFMRFIWTQVLTRLRPLLRLLVTPNVHTTLESGEALARLAVSEDVEGVTGVYFEGLKEIKSSVDSYDEDKQDDLWDWTAKFIAKDDEEVARFGKI